MSPRNRLLAFLLGVGGLAGLPLHIAAQPGAPTGPPIPPMGRPNPPFGQPMMPPGGPGGPPVGQPMAKPVPPLGPSPAALQDAALMLLLAEPIEAKDFTNPLTLKDTLGLVYEKFAAKGKELPIRVNAAAFKGKNQELDVNDAQVSLPSVPRQAPVRVALEILLSQLPEPATYLIRQGHIEVVPAARAEINTLLKQPVVGTFEQLPLRHALDELAHQTGASINLDVRVGDKASIPVSATFRHSASLRDAITVLADAAGLRMAVLHDSLYITLPADAERLERGLPLR